MKPLRNMRRGFFRFMSRVEDSSEMKKKKPQASVACKARFTSRAYQDHCGSKRNNLFEDDGSDRDFFRFPLDAGLIVCVFSNNKCLGFYICTFLFGLVVQLNRIPHYGCGG